jgi:hypothetical protein
MRRKIFFILVAVVLGYVSNGSSQSACLEDAVFWYSQVMMSGQPYYVVLKPGQEHIRHPPGYCQSPFYRPALAF